MPYIRKTKRFYLVRKTRSNVWGSLKMLKCNRRKWNFLRRKKLNFTAVPYTRKYKLRLPAQRQTAKGAYKRFLKKKKRFNLYYGVIKNRRLKGIMRGILTQKKKENQIQTLSTIFNSRLDIVVFRMRFANTIQDAQKLILHGKILVNGKINKNINYQLKPEDFVIINPIFRYIIYRKLVTMLWHFAFFYAGQVLKAIKKKRKRKWRYKRLKKRYRTLFSLEMRRKRKRPLIRLKLNFKQFYNEYGPKQRFLHYKNRYFMNCLNFQEHEKITYFFHFCTIPSLIVNYNYLIGVYITHITAFEQPFAKYMNMYGILRYYNKQK